MTPIAFGDCVTCRLGHLVQSFVCTDLEEPENVARVVDQMPPTVDVVYSDPPWNPGNATYWRTHAGDARGARYERFLAGWVALAAEAQQRGAQTVLVEQSANEAHAGMLLAAMERDPGWALPLQRRYLVRYGSASRLLPNALYHFGRAALGSDPTDLHGESMTLRALHGVDLPGHRVVLEPCVGKGMTSRVAHAFGWSLVGSELNPKRLAHTVKWLERQGYTVTR